MTEKPEVQDAEESVWEPNQPVVPSTWLLADFGDAFAPVSVNQRKVPAKAYKTSGALPIVDQGQAFIGGYTDDESLAVDPGEGLIVFGDHTRIFKRVSFRFAAGADGIKVLRPLLCDSAYAYYACQSLKFPNRGYSRHYSFLTRCKLPIAPEPEQKRIVSKIDELFSRIDEGERALARVQKLVERYRQSVLKAAVTGELTREWREKNKDKLESGEALLARILKARREAWEKAELSRLKAKGITPANDKWKQDYEGPISPETAELPELPEDWAWASLDQFAAPVERAIQSGPFGSNLLHSEFQPEGKLVIGIDNVRDGWYSRGSQNRISDDKFEQLQKYQARPKDFLITVMATIGRTCVLPDDIEPSIITKHVYRFTLDHNLVLPEFVNLCVMGSPAVRSQIFGNVRGQTRPGLNKSLLTRFGFPLPPIEEQRLILDRSAELLSQLAPSKETIDAQQLRSGGLRQAVLKAAFAGHLVGQDPTEEPASTLLERIAAERGTDNAAPTRGRKKRSAPA